MYEYETHVKSCTYACIVRNQQHGLHICCHYTLLCYYKSAVWKHSARKQRTLSDMRSLLELMCIFLHCRPPIGWERYFELYILHLFARTPACCVVVPLSGRWVLIKPNPRRAASLCSSAPAARLSQECRNLLSQNSSNRPPHRAPMGGTGD